MCSIYNIIKSQLWDVLMKLASNEANACFGPRMNTIENYLYGTIFTVYKEKIDELH